MAKGKGMFWAAAAGAALAAFVHKPTRKKILNNLDTWGESFDGKKDELTEKASSKVEELKDKAKVKANLAEKEAESAASRVKAKSKSRT